MVDCVKREPETPENREAIYLDKRIHLPYPLKFYIFLWADTPTWPFCGRLNVGGPFFTHNDPTWTLHKGKWTEDFDACVKEYTDFKTRI